ncbi:MAG: polyhydroxyalkanoic acid system family protein [Myxococcaceae bacterium]|nr:polyhydroxyalkanoic acid system family protein [Myxococcaceae bacterium]
MGMMKLEMPHSLSHEDAKARVQALLDYWSRKYGVKASWAGDKATFVGKVMGVTFDGWLTVAANRIGGEATDPGMLLRGQTQKYLQRKFGDYLDAKKSLADVQGEV